MKRIKSKKEILEFEKKLKTDKKFEKEWLKKQQALAEKVKNELFTESFIKKIKM